MPSCWRHFPTRTLRSSSHCTKRCLPGVISRRARQSADAANHPRLGRRDIVFQYGALRRSGVHSDRCRRTRAPSRRRRRLVLLRHDGHGAVQRAASESKRRRARSSAGGDHRSRAVADAIRSEPCARRNGHRALGSALRGCRHRSARFRVPLGLAGVGTSLVA